MADRREFLGGILGGVAAIVAAPKLKEPTLTFRNLQTGVWAGDLVAWRDDPRNIIGLVHSAAHDGNVYIQVSGNTIVKAQVS